uniref:Uncharacterized protein n=1 Tax=mine drainage metagenome TaxID=410659 RepID=E6QKV3_9ZZZZ
MTGIGREQHGPHNASGNTGAGNIGSVLHGFHLPHGFHLDALLSAVTKSLGKSLDLAGRGYCCTCNPIEDAAPVSQPPIVTRVPSDTAQTFASSATHQQTTEVHPHENLSGK